MAHPIQVRYLIPTLVLCLRPADPFMGIGKLGTNVADGYR